MTKQSCSTEQDVRTLGASVLKHAVVRYQNAAKSAVVAVSTCRLNCLIGLANMWIVFKRVVAPSRPQPWPLHHRGVAIIVPCYLPNEQGIIMATVEHMATQLQYSGSLTVWVVYNTPHRLGAAQEALDSLDGREYAPGRLLRVVDVKGSTSKAENLDAALQLIQARASQMIVVNVFSTACLHSLP